MDIINIVVTVDINYIQHAGVMLCSLFENNWENHFNVYIIIDFDHNDNLQQLKKLVNRYKQELEFIKIDKTQVNNLILSGHATQAVYFRLLIPLVLDRNISRVLYLDSDIIIKRDIRKLWEVEIEEYALAAVAEPLFDRHEQLGISVENSYFNSGVMLINLDYWRKENISQKVLKFIQNNPDKIIFWDQDGLNVFLKDQWLELPPVWNQQTSHFSLPAIEVAEKKILECLNDPAIIHYSSKFKPWHFWCDHPLKAEYYTYLKSTPWKGFQLIENSQWHQFKQCIKRAVNTLIGRKIFEVYA